MARVECSGIVSNNTNTNTVIIVFVVVVGVVVEPEGGATRRGSFRRLRERSLIGSGSTTATATATKGM